MRDIAHSRLFRRDYRDCHIRPDLVLICQMQDVDRLVLVCHGSRREIGICRSSIVSRIRLPIALLITLDRRRPTERGADQAPIRRNKAVPLQSTSWGLTTDRRSVQSVRRAAAGDCSGTQDHRARFDPARSLARRLLRRGRGARRQPAGRASRPRRPWWRPSWLRGIRSTASTRGFGKLASIRIAGTRPRGPAAQHRAVALRRGRRAAVVVRLAPRHGVEDGEPRPGRVRGPVGSGPAPLRMPGPEPRSGDPRPGLGRRLRRPGAAVASHGRADRRRRVLARGPAPPRRRRRSRRAGLVHRSNSGPRRDWPC